MTEQLISNISDTARWVAWYRAMETDRPDAVFRDPFAKRLAGDRGRQIVESMPGGTAMSWPMVVRTAVMDELILRVIARDGVDGVLNLACGLDARPWRLDLPPSLMWVDVDHPVMIDAKTTELARETPRCRYEAVALDLADTAARAALFDRVAGQARKFLVISEGLLVYLPAPAVSELARDLHARGSFHFWLFDLASPQLLKYLAKGWGKEVARGNAPFQFGPAENTRYFAPMGWKENEWRSSFHEGVRIKRTMRLWWLWMFLGKISPKAKQEEFRRFSGIALLERS